MRDRRFCDLPQLVNAGDVLVMNDTRVIRRGSPGASKAAAGSKCCRARDRSRTGVGAGARQQEPARRNRLLFTGTRLLKCSAATANSSSCGSSIATMSWRCWNARAACPFRPIYAPTRRRRRGTLSDRLRARAGRGCCADRGSAFRRRAARRAQCARRCARMADAARWRRHISADARRKPGRAPDAQRVVLVAAVDRRCG